MERGYLLRNMLITLLQLVVAIGYGEAGGGMPMGSDRLQEIPLDSSTVPLPATTNAAQIPGLPQTTEVPQRIDNNPVDNNDTSAVTSLAPKTSILPTFKFFSEERCFRFLKRLRSKGRNKHENHPFTCPQVFDGILCWRSADPSEELLKVCPNGPFSKVYAKRKCVNGMWKDYGPVNPDLKIPDVTTTDYRECKTQAKGSLFKTSEPGIKEEMPTDQKPELTSTTSATLGSPDYVATDKSSEQLEQFTRASIGGKVPSGERFSDHKSL